MKAVVLGANGYGGMLLLRLLARHPNISQVVAASRSQAGTAVADADPGLPPALLATGRVAATVLDPAAALEEGAEVVFSALPHGASAEVCAPVVGTIPVIDLSADFRFADPMLFTAAYGTAPPAANHQMEAVYGLTEWYRTAIASAMVIANPGCYPTATLLPLLPIAAAGLISEEIIVNAMSGISGAGRTAKTNLLLAERAENVNAYNPGSRHRHRAEIVERLALAMGIDAAAVARGSQRPNLLFTPHLVPIKQGMAVTTVVTVTDPERAMAAVTERYRDEPFVHVVSEPPETRHVRATNDVRIAMQREGDRLILMSVIDNLWKGASGQAIQNMNRRFGLDERAGLDAFGDL